MRPIPFDIVTPFLNQHEGYVLRVYDDARPEYILKEGDQVFGTLTAGRGHTGRELYIGMEVTPDMAEKWYQDDVRNKAQAPLCAKMNGGERDLTDYQYAALLCFVYNLGTGNPNKKEWTIWLRLRNKQYDQVPIEMNKFVNYQGKKCQGLVNRRADEVKMWSTDEPGSIDASPPSHMTRTDITPPTPADPVPLYQSKMFWATVATLLASAPATITQVVDKLTPLEGQFAFVKTVVDDLSAMSAFCAAAAVLFTAVNKAEQRS